MMNNKKYIIHLGSANGGFVATIAVVLLATSIMAVSLSSISAAISYSEAVTKRELRIQARMNATACVDRLTLMVVKDYFFDGEVSVPDFGCVSVITNDFNGNITLDVVTRLASVNDIGRRQLTIGNNNHVRIISDQVY